MPGFPSTPRSTHESGMRRQVAIRECGERTPDGEPQDGEEGPMVVATTETIAGQRIVATIGQVLGLAVRTRGIEGNIMAGLAHFPAVDGDAMAEFVASLLVARDEAIARMVTQATECGASAVVGVRFDCAAVGREMSEIVAYGTAVIIEPLV